MRNFIIGTDWWTDCDDAVALRIAVRAHKAGHVRLLGVGLNACMEHSVASLAGFMALEGAGDVPIGVDLEAGDFGGRPPYQERLARYPSAYKANSDAEDAVRLYRRLLADAEGPVEIIEIGYLQVMAGLLESLPDDISDMSGLELIRERVSKIWVMAGKWDEPRGRENNFARNTRSRRAGSVFCEKCPVPVTFLGLEAGMTVITGGGLDHGDHLWQALNDHGSGNGRMSWDPMLLILALEGDEQAAGYDAVYGHASVDAETGENSFVNDPAGRHCYVVKNMPDGYYEKQINDLIR